MSYYRDEPDQLRMSCMQMARGDARRNARVLVLTDESWLKRRADFYRGYIDGSGSGERRSETNACATAAALHLPVRFRKRPVEIEAFKMTDSICKDWGRGPVWFIDAFANRRITKPTTDTGYWIKTLEGTMWCALNDWLVRGIKDELYPVRDDIFRESYEAVR